MKNFVTTLFIFISFLGIKGNDFKVVGYLPTYRWGFVNQIDYESITHLAVCFSNPNAQGEFSFSQDLQSVRNNCLNNDVKLFVSIGGGGLSTQQEQIYEDLTQDANRSDFIHQLINFLTDNSFEGVDVDLEGDLVTMDTYNPFVLELKDSLVANDLEMSAALTVWTATQGISNASLAAMDFINIMAYDETGPWTAQNPGPHSDMDFAQYSYNYFSGRVNDDKKLVLGVPFYGWEFDYNSSSSADVSASTWCQIINNYPEAINLDEYDTGTGIVYYNGINTIQDKTEWMMNQNGGGIMIWELGQDCMDENSLLEVINTTINQTVSNQFIAENKLNIYPNPINNQLNIDLNGIVNYQLFSLDGKLVANGTCKNGVINTSNWTSGIYTIRFESDNQLYHQKVIKQ